MPARELTIELPKHTNDPETIRAICLSLNRCAYLFPDGRFIGRFLIASSFYVLALISRGE